MDARHPAILAIALLLVPLAAGTTYTRHVYAPSAERAGSPPDVVLTGFAFCDDLGGPLDCCNGGVGAIISLAGDCGEPDLNPADFASGSCTVRQTGAALLASFGSFFFACGSDRDDDGIVANVDTTPPGNDPSLWDDDFTVGCYASGGGACGGLGVPAAGPAPLASKSLLCVGCLGQGNSNNGSGGATVNLCLRSDVTGGLPGQDGQFDDVAVFIGMNILEARAPALPDVGLATSPAAASFRVDLTLTGTAGCTPSGH